MINFWIVVIFIFALFTLILAKFSLNYYKKQQSEKMWKLFGMRTRYWQVIVLLSMLLTFLLILILVKLGILIL